MHARNVRFPLDDRVPRHWHRGKPAITAYFDSLSVMLPSLERFVVASVRAHRDVPDPVLAAAARTLCAQEGFHSREHARYNAMLGAKGYPVAALERRAERLMNGVARRLSPRRQLAVTCALEHLTAVKSYWVLLHPETMDGADPVMAAVWRWHAVEESEHRHVAFDLYLAAGGGYVERSVLMALTSTVFWSKLAEQQLRLMAVDGTWSSPRVWADMLRYVVVELGPSVPTFLAYFRPGFHPSQIASDGPWEQDSTSGGHRGTTG